MDSNFFLYFVCVLGYFLMMRGNKRSLYLFKTEINIRERIILSDNFNYKIEFNYIVSNLECNDKNETYFEIKLLIKDHYGEPIFNSSDLSNQSNLKVNQWNKGTICIKIDSNNFTVNFYLF
jgi:hypothetical protein